MNKFAREVIATFFQPFYHERILIVQEVGKKYYRELDISILTFWFSVIDFYGGLYSIGRNNYKKTYGNGRLKLADKESFTLFVRDFFPSPENELGEFIYTIFRSGIVHQLSPKKGGIVWEKDNPKLLWVKVDDENADMNANKVATINIHRLQELAFNAYTEFKNKIETGQLNLQCEYIYNYLLAIHDGLEDGSTIHNQYSKLAGETKTYITV